MRILKNNNIIHKIYFIAGSAVLNFLSVFIKTNNKLILFNSFGGKKYDDSPKVIYERMKNDNRFNGYRIVWAFHEPAKFASIVTDSVKVASFSFFITALKAKCWITNSSLQCGLSFKKKGTFYLNTWHGSALKTGGSDIKGHGTLKAMTTVKSKVDLMSAQSNYDADIYSRIFRLEREKIIVCGFPRNDELFHDSNERKRCLKEKFGITGKQVILYAPTYREYEIDSKLHCTIAPPLHFDEWEKALGEDTIVLFRAHYEVAKILDIDFECNEFVRDVFGYGNLNELMLMSDMLITDYSSIMFDYSILERPIFLFLYDYDSYAEKRGLYCDIREELPFAYHETNLLQLITQQDQSVFIQQVKALKARRIESGGNAAQILVDKIHETMKGAKILS